MTTPQINRHKAGAVLFSFAFYARFAAWVGLGWIGLDWIGLGWAGPGLVGLDFKLLGLVRLGLRSLRNVRLDCFRFLSPGRRHGFCALCARSVRRGQATPVVIMSFVVFRDRFFARLFTAHDPARLSGQEVFLNSRVESSRVRNLASLSRVGSGRGGFEHHGSGRVGSPWHDPTREK